MEFVIEVKQVEPDCWQALLRNPNTWEWSKGFGTTPARATEAAWLEWEEGARGKGVIR